MSENKGKKSNKKESKSATALLRRTPHKHTIKQATSTSRRHSDWVGEQQCRVIPTCKEKFTWDCGWNEINFLIYRIKKKSSSSLPRGYSGNQNVPLIRNEDVIKHCSTRSQCRWALKLAYYSYYIKLIITGLSKVLQFIKSYLFFNNHESKNQDMQNFFSDWSILTLA